MSKSGVGSVRELSPGTWQVRVSRGYRRDGSRRTVSRCVSGTERDARVEAARLATAMGRDAYAGDPMTLAEWYLGVFLPSKEATCTRATVEFYRNAWRYIEPEFGGVAVGDLTNTAIQRWILTLPPKSAPHYARALRAALNAAAFDHVIQESPMGPQYRFRMPRRDTRPLPVWGPAEVRDALERLQGHDLYPLWLVMVGGGLSESEALAVDRERVEWADTPTGTMARVYVDRAYTALDGMKEPKNARRYRATIMPPMFAEPLRRAIGGTSGPLLTCRRGRNAGRRMGVAGAGAMWRRLFDEGHRLAGMPYVTLNRMRATYSTMMQLAGVDSTIINAMQGRSANSRVLYSNYLNPFEASFASAARRLGDAASDTGRVHFGDGS